MNFLTWLIIVWLAAGVWLGALFLFLAAWHASVSNSTDDHDL